MTTYFRVRCHCGLNDFNIGVETSRFPLNTNLCHCTSCRHGSGHMSNHDVLIIGPPSKYDAQGREGTSKLEPASLDGMFGHERSKLGTRYMCRKCFAHIFFVERAEQWWLNAGLLGKDVWSGRGGKGKVIEVTEHIFIEPTLDGGFADHLREVGGKKMKRWGDHGNEEVELGWKSEELKTKQADQQVDRQGEDVLPFECVCKTISFKLSRPQATDTTGNKYLIPGRSSDDAPRFRAFHCLCNICRLTSGMLVASRATVPPDYVLNASTSKPVILDDEDQRPGGLVQYESSPGVYRESCGTCGASIFYWKKGQTKEWVDLCVGLIDEDVDGARAEGWLSWDKAVQHKEDAALPSLGKALEKGLVATLEKRKETRRWFPFSTSS